MSSSCHFNLRSVLSFREMTSEDCLQGRVGGRVWQHRQQKTFCGCISNLMQIHSPLCALCHVQCLLLLVRKLDHGIIIIIVTEALQKYSKMLRRHQLRKLNENEQKQMITIWMGMNPDNNAVTRHLQEWYNLLVSAGVRHQCCDHCINQINVVFFFK